MELQSASPALIEAVRNTASDAPTSITREVRPEIIRHAGSRFVEPATVEEIMVPDLRAGLSPAQSVEQKLTAMLQGGAAIPVSHFRLAKLCRKG
jgi:hypothetical protein